MLHYLMLIPTFCTFCSLLGSASLGDAVAPPTAPFIAAPVVKEMHKRVVVLHVGVRGDAFEVE